ncbi:GlcG/HbpS family heme-binding protein [Ancylobacter mangrovi]|uniref:Heme-binding protein n=1 Tax=Ancylobacter mangrovi TaxID=2972472 RepID=A0A9X2PE21_9HYPH|nr:heme-binding protein [Ancylobacter mangrovi]MCS0493892.1 heme-binding protein [Ancylobacter mangrovi]MCS0501343.1 heme-binding protein [Ancylobacter mangrovi]
MSDLSLAAAQTILSTALDHCRKGNFKPMAVVVLDARGAVKAAAAEDGTSLKRFEVAHGKAFGALSLGMGSRSIFKRAKEQAFFVAAVSHVAGGALVPVPGGVLIRDAGGALLGAVGISGDTSDNDEAAASAGIAAAGFTADPGAD